jgi:hypothetical protein
MHYVHRPDLLELKKIRALGLACPTWLEAGNKLVPSKDKAANLGEIRLFFDGFLESVDNIFARQIQLETLYNNSSFGGLENLRKAKGLQEQQNRAIHEFKRFRDRIETELRQAW